MIYSAKRGLTYEDLRQRNRLYNETRNKSEDKKPLPPPTQFQPNPPSQPSIPSETGIVIYSVIL